MRTTVRLFSLLTLILLASCSRSPEKQIIGRWKEVGDSSIGVFHEDGTFELLPAGQNVLSGKFSFITPGKLKLEFMGKAAAALGPRVFEVAISDNKMTWKDAAGVTSELVRTK